MVWMSTYTTQKTWNVIDHLRPNLTEINVTRTCPCLRNEVGINISDVTLRTVTDVGLVTWLETRVVNAHDHPGPETSVLKVAEAFVIHGVVLYSILRCKMNMMFSYRASKRKMGMFCLSALDINEECGARSRYQGHGQLITPLSIWGVITCPRP